MPTEPAISEDFERYDDEKEFRRLVRAVKFSQKHYLYFVCCNQVPKQNELIADAKKNLKGKKIRVIKFKKPVADLLTELQKKKISKDCEAVFVQGLEYSISSDAKGAENTLIHNLNISRDAFKKYLSCPLFLWLPEYVLVKITRHAPDFFSVRSGTFYFSDPPEKVAEQISQSVISNYLESSSLSLAEKLIQIEILENLLAEYQGLHQEKQNKEAEAYLLSKLSDFLFSLSEYRKAIDYYKQSLKIFREIGDRQGESSSLGNIGLIYFNLGDYQKAIDYQEQSLKISREVEDRQGESSNLSNLANVYDTLGEYRKAIDYQEQSLKISREVEDQQGEAISLNTLGLSYLSLGEYLKAIDYCEQALKISHEIGDQQSRGISLSNLGFTYLSLGEYRKAINYNKQSLKVFREIGNRQSEGASLSNLGAAYLNLGETEKACNLWKDALIIFEAIESPNANIVRRWTEETCDKLVNG